MSLCIFGHLNRAALQLSACTCYLGCSATVGAAVDALQSKGARDPQAINQSINWLRFACHECRLNKTSADVRRKSSACKCSERTCVEL